MCLLVCANNVMSAFLVTLLHTYIRILSLLLHFDQSADVRMICLKALQELYNPSLVYHLSMFTAKFKERLMKMRCDVNEAVAVESIRLLGQMLQ